jgi:hypothetical protein
VHEGTKRRRGRRKRRRTRTRRRREIGRRRKVLHSDNSGDCMSEVV